MWTLFIRLGVMLSTVLVGKQFLESFWPSEIRPTRLYQPYQIAAYLGISTKQVMWLIQTNLLHARWIDGEPLVLGAAILEFLVTGTRESDD